MKKIIFTLIIGLSTVFAAGQDELKSKELITRISSEEVYLRIDNYTIIDDLNFADVEKLFEDKKRKSTTIIKKNKRRSDTIIRYSQNNRVLIDATLEFDSCIFKGEIDAKNRFKNQNTNVRKFTQFNGDLIFKDCLFMEEVDLSSVEFEGDLRFMNCTFKRPFSFSGIRSYQDFIFEYCIFDHMCFFNNMLISKKAILDQCNFNNAFSLSSTIFSVEPDITSSTFREIKLRNCRVIDQPFFWYFEDDKKYEALLSKVKYDKAFYGTKIEHHKNMSIYTSRSNWGGKNTMGKILNFWDARAEIKSDEGKYKVWGRIVWDKNQNILIIDHAKLKAPNGSILVEGKKLEIDINQPSNYKVL